MNFFGRIIKQIDIFFQLIESWIFYVKFVRFLKNRHQRVVSKLRTAFLRGCASKNAKKLRNIALWAWVGKLPRLRLVTLLSKRFYCSLPFPLSLYVSMEVSHVRNTICCGLLSVRVVFVCRFGKKNVFQTIFPTRGVLSFQKKTLFFPIIFWKFSSFLIGWLIGRRSCRDWYVFFRDFWFFFF